LFALLGKGDALVGDCRVEFCDGCDMLVDDRLVDKRPKSFGRLQLRTIGRQRNEANPIGDFEIGGPCHPALSSTRRMMRRKPASASRAKVSSSASKNSFATPFDRYQKVSPVAGETNAVT
jgi:hypothetical protein